MDGIHDLGGMQGFGPIAVKSGSSGFVDLKDWEKRMWALARSNLVAGTTIDWFRHCVERMTPADYLQFAYFNKWCTNYLVMMLDNGDITMDEIKRGHVGNPGPEAAVLSVQDVLDIVRNHNTGFETEALAPPAFGEGEVVETLRLATANHTRLPRYARGVRGKIIAHHGAHLLPDAGAQGIHRGEHLYTVAFGAVELWGEDADPRDDVTLDLWESYLVHPR